MMATLCRVSLSLLFVGLSVFLFVSAMTISTKGAYFAVSPRFVPLGLSVVMFCLAVRGLVEDFRTATAGEPLGRAAAGSIVGFMVLVLLYVLLMGTVNFHALTFVFLAGSFFYLGIRSVPGILVAAACLVASEFLIFEYAFKVKFP